MYRIRFQLFLFLILLLYSPLGLAFDNTQLFEDAEKGNREACYTLAHLFAKGQGGVALDISAAISWFEKAAGAGHRDAAFDLAMLYLGDAIPGNKDDKALFWLNKAAQMGHPDALYFLALAYKKSNPDKAASFLKKAAEAGHRKAREERDVE